jgi:hypothetical protein
VKNFPAVPGHEHKNTRIFGYEKNEIVVDWRELYCGQFPP